MKKLIPRHQQGNQFAQFNTFKSIANAKTREGYQYLFSHLGNDYLPVTSSQDEVVEPNYYKENGIEYGRNLISKGVKQVGVPKNYEDGYIAPAVKGTSSGYLITRPQVGGWERFIPSWTDAYKNISKNLK